MSITPERLAEIQAYARATRPTTRIAQGLPPDLTDPGQLERLAVLFDTEPRKESA